MVRNTTHHEMNGFENSIEHFFDAVKSQATYT